MSPTPSATPRPPGPLLALLVTLASGLAVFFWWLAVAPRVPVPVTLLIAVLGGRAAFALLAPRVPGAGLREALGLSGVDARVLPSLVLLAAAFLPLVQLQALLLGAPPFDWQANPFVVPLGPADVAGSTGRVLALLAFGLVEPVATELLFRGWLQPGLVARWGRARGILGASALSAAAYAALAGFGPALAATALTGFLLALLFGWIRERTGSTPAAILVHGLMGLAWASGPAPDVAGMTLAPLVASVTMTVAGFVLLERSLRPAPGSTPGSRDHGPTT